MPFTKDDPNINRNGRPKGSGLSLTKILKEELEELIEVTKEGVATGEKVTIARVIIRREIQKALKGDQKAIEKIWSYVDGMPKQTLGSDSENPFIILLQNALNKSGTVSNTGSPEDKE